MSSQRSTVQVGDIEYGIQNEESVAPFCSGSFQALLEVILVVGSWA